LDIGQEDVREKVSKEGRKEKRFEVRGKKTNKKRSPNKTASSDIKGKGCTMKKFTAEGCQV